MPLNSSKVQEVMIVYKNFLQGKVNNTEIASYEIINKIIERESFIIAINNVFVIIALLFCIGIMLMRLWR